MGWLGVQFGLRQNHKPIRMTMEKAGEAVQAIKPVFLMSPLSVAMYLPADGPRFDVVIFDEASQVKPEDAFGGILRARQTIVVGDSKQMPPTSFFDKLTSEEVDEGTGRRRWRHRARERPRDDEREAPGQEPAPP